MGARPRTVVVTAAVITALAVLTAACGSSTSTIGAAKARAAAHKGLGGTNVLLADGTPKPGGTLVYGIEGETNGFNPTLSRWTEPAITEAETVFDPIAAWDADLQAKPYLAESITAHDNYTEWDIKLRSGISFQDGEPLDAAAVVTDLKAVKASALTSSSLTPVESISATDDLTVALHMSTPWTAFPSAMTSQIGMIAAPKQIASGNTQDPIGTGPFTFGSWVPTSKLVVNRNTHYWRKGLPYLNQVVFKPIPEAETLYDSLLTGDLSLVSTSNTLIQEKLKAQAESGHIQEMFSSGETEENMVMLNTSASPTNDLRVRQAIAYASNIAQLGKVQGFSASAIADGPFAPGSKWDVPTGYPKYDLAKAKQLVAEVQAQSGPIKFNLQCTTDTFVLQACQLLQADWKAAGIEANIVSVAEDTLISNAIGGQYQATIWRQFGSQDPDQDTTWWNGANTKPPLALNMARNVDPKIDAAIAVGRTSANQFNRTLAYITVAKRLAIDLPYIWIDHTVWVVAAQNSVRGLDRATFPDGSAAAPIVSGTQRLGQVWLTG